jgi:hypothetical protein
MQYPQVVLQEKVTLGTEKTNVVWDIDKGVLCCLDKKGRVSSALLGQRELTLKDVKNIYG